MNSQSELKIKLKQVSLNQQFFYRQSPAQNAWFSPIIKLETFIIFSPNFPNVLSYFNQSE